MKAPAAINRASRIPTTNEITGCRLGPTSFDLAPFCAAPIPNQKRSLSIDRYLRVPDLKLAPVSDEGPQGRNQPPGCSGGSPPSRWARQANLFTEHAFHCSSLSPCQDNRRLWQRRTNLWRRVTSPERLAKRLTSTNGSRDSRTVRIVIAFHLLKPRETCHVRIHR